MLMCPLASQKRCYGSSRVCRALQRVELARPQAHGHASSPAHSGSYAQSTAHGQTPVHTRGRFTVTTTSFFGSSLSSWSSTHRARGRQDQHQQSQQLYASPLDAVADDLASFDADDNSGPPATRVNSIRAPRLSFPGLSAEAFFFKHTLDGQAAGDGGDDTVFAERRQDTASSLGEESASSSSMVPHGREALPFCRLCREEIEAPPNPRLHIIAGNRASPLNHNCREVVLDSLSLLALRGFPIDHMERVWSRLLYDSPLFPRVRSLVAPSASMLERAEGLVSHLILLRDLGILDVSLASTSSDGEGGNSLTHRRRLAFERLEYIGDNAWRDCVSDRLMLLFPDQRWAYSEGSSAFNALRDAVEMNVTLGLLYDRLHLARLLPVSARLSKTASKGKADVVEAVLGELHTAVWGMVPMLYDAAPVLEVNGLLEKSQVALVEHCLTEIYDLLVLSLAVELSHSAVPLAKEMAAHHLWNQVQPAMCAQKPLALRRLTSAASAPRVTVSVPVRPHWPPPPPPSVPAVPAASSTTPSVEPEDAARLQQHEGEGKEKKSETSPSVLASSSSSVSALAQLVARPPTRFTLPTSLPLSSEPTPAPTVESLTSPLLALPQEALPQETLVRPFPNQPDVYRDVFAAHRRVYDALGLLDPGQLLMSTMCVRRRPAWRLWAATLVPGVEWIPAEHLGSTHEQAMLGLPLTASAPTQSGVFSEEIQYFRDARFDLSPQPSAPPSPSLISPLLTTSVVRDGAEEAAVATDSGAMRLRIALANAPPRDLQMEPLSEADDEAAASSLDDDAIESARSHYAPSRYVPSSVKPPLGGVLTERNTCHGAFAFLSNGEAPWEALMAQTSPSPAVITEAASAADALHVVKRRAAALWESENAFFPRRINPFRVVAGAMHTAPLPPPA